jgi:hypothetical protein
MEHYDGDEVMMTAMTPSESASSRAFDKRSSLSDGKPFSGGSLKNS